MNYPDHKANQRPDRANPMRKTIFNKKNIPKCCFASLRIGTWPSAVCQQKSGAATCHIQLVTFDAGSQDFNALNYIQAFEYGGDIMVARYTDAAVRFKALAHPVRLQILDMLRSGEVCVCHMEAVLGKRQAYISQQLMVLRDAGLVCKSSNFMGQKLTKNKGDFFVATGR
jgi:DNA-binding transcriptional ArsR family regulator